MTRFHMELAAQATNATPEQFDDILPGIADALYECDGIDNQDLEGDSSTQIVTFTLDIEDDDEVKAFARSVAVVRTALHAAGGATPGWEDHFQVFMRARSERELLDA